MARLLGQPLGWRKVDVRHVDGLVWLLHQNPDNPLRFVCATGNRILTPPNKFVHDFGSIPRIAQLVLGGPAGHPDFAQHAGKVYPLHDWAYERQQWDNGKPMTRREADELLLAALEAVHCEEWYCRTVYRAVRIGGARHWRKHTRKGAVCPRYGSG